MSVVSEDVREESSGEARAVASRLSISERRAQLAYLISGAAIIGVVFFYLQYSTKAICCGDFDGYYHFKWARLLWESFTSGGFLPTFGALPLTTLNPSDYVDHHFLFHVLQIPFTWIGSDLHTGAKISAWFFATLAVFACYWIIVRYRIRYTLLWLLALLASSNAFLFRMNMTKAMSLSLALLIVGLVLLFERKYKWLGVLSFVFVWAYSLWFLLPIAVMIWAGVVLWSERRIEWQPVVSCAIGSIAGLIINPYFPKNIKLFYEHARMKLAPAGFPVSTGQEWYPWDSRQFIAQMLVACVAMLIGYIAFDWRNRRASAKPLFFLVFSTLLMLMTAYSKRFNEYFPPFAVLFAAFTLQPIFTRREEEVAKMPREVLDDLKPYLDRDAPSENPATLNERWREDEAVVLGLIPVAIASMVVMLLKLPVQIEYGIGVMLAAVLLLAGGVGYYVWRRSNTVIAFFIAFGLGVALVGNMNRTSLDIADTNTNYQFRASPDRFRDAMAWVRANVPKNELIFNTNWDHFPKLYFESSEHAYVSGLDPNYLLDQNRELAEAFDRIRTGEEENPAPVIRDKFGARYIFTDQKKRGEDFFFNIMRSGWVDEVYDDDYATILRIRDERGPVPDEYRDDQQDAAPSQAQPNDARSDEAPAEETDDATDEATNEDAPESSATPQQP